MPVPVPVFCQLAQGELEEHVTERREVREVVRERRLEPPGAKDEGAAKQGHHSLLLEGAPRGDCGRWDERGERTSEKRPAANRKVSLVPPGKGPGCTFW
jgi:hypothetical protein